MAYERRTWYQRLGQGLNKFLIGEKDAEGKQELTNAPDSVTQQGDVISAENLNDFEGRIQAGFAGQRLTKIWENPNPTTSFEGGVIDLGQDAEELVISYGLGSPRTDAEKFIHIKGTSTVVYNTPTTSLFHATGFNFYVRNFKVYTTDGTTKLDFENGKKVSYDTSTSTWSHSLAESYSLIPHAVYKIGDIYNS